MSHKSKDLEHLWATQMLFNSNLVDYDHLTEDKKQELTKDYILHMISETNSLLESINWKMHHKKELKVNRSALTLEWIDVFKYWLSIGLLWGISSEEFLKSFDEKSRLVEQRYLQEFADYKDKKICICDIDGILSDYPETFLDYVGERTGVCRSVDELRSINLYKELEDELDPGTLSSIKYDYRVTGQSRAEGVDSQARDLLEAFKDKGYYIVVLTSRPLNTFQNLYLDTYTWLVDNGIPFDMLLSDDKKRSQVSKIVKTTFVDLVIDDTPSIIEGLKGIKGVRTFYLKDKPYNRDYICEGNVVRVKDFSEIYAQEVGDEGNA